jgi:hypothetical protein
VRRSRRRTELENDFVFVEEWESFKFDTYERAVTES